MYRPILALALLNGVASAQSLSCNTQADCYSALYSYFGTNADSINCYGSNVFCQSNHTCSWDTVNRCGSAIGTNNNQCCYSANGNTSCNYLTCQMACSGTFKNCRHASNDFSFGCDTDTSSDPNNCGGCGIVCPAINGIAGCIGSKCVTTCNAGASQCNPTVNACDNLSNDVNNCGSCGHVCSRGAGVLSTDCNSGTCGIASCVAGLGNCDGLASNGCETFLNSDPANCGACGAACSATLAAHEVHTCSAGTCGSACATGYKDCNGNPADGCETQIIGSDVNNCGACGNVCPSGSATQHAVCTSGVCMLSNCALGTETCGSGPLCGSVIATDVSNCGGCGMACSSSHITPSCAGGVCNGACASGYADCNGDKKSDGCEVNLLADNLNCGSCGNVCNIPHAQGFCSSGACTFTQCATGYADCDGNPANGCETLGACPQPDMAVPDDLAHASSHDMAMAGAANDLSTTTMTGHPTSGCSYSGSPTSGAWLLLLVCGLLVARRRLSRG
jgi:hypothetical protein